MATLVGMQDNFTDALRELIELDFDAVEAYEAAINRLENVDYKNKLEEFRKDHLRHISELSELFRTHHEEPPVGPSIGKQWIAKGKVVLAELVGDKAILAAMSSNETDTNTAYERLHGRTDMWEDARDIITRGLEDERRHKQWLEAI